MGRMYVKISSILWLFVVITAAQDDDSATPRCRNIKIGLIDRRDMLGKIIRGLVHTQQSALGEIQMHWNHNPPVLCTNERRGYKMNTQLVDVKPELYDAQRDAILKADYDIFIGEENELMLNIATAHSIPYIIYEMGQKDMKQRRSAKYRNSTIINMFPLFKDTTQVFLDFAKVHSRTRIYLLAAAEYSEKAVSIRQAFSSDNKYIELNVGLPSHSNTQFDAAVIAKRIVEKGIDIVFYWLDQKDFDIFQVIVETQRRTQGKGKIVWVDANLDENLRRHPDEIRKSHDTRTYWFAISALPALNNRNKFDSLVDAMKTFGVENTDQVSIALDPLLVLIRALQEVPFNDYTREKLAKKLKTVTVNNVINERKWWRSTMHIAGNILFDEFGTRKNFTLFLRIKNMRGYFRDKLWSSIDNVLPHLFTSAKRDDVKRITIAAVLDEPFIYHKTIDTIDYVYDNKTKRLSDFQGLCVDILKKLRKYLYDYQGLRVEFVVVPVAGYGKSLDTGDWSGAFGYLQKSLFNVSLLVGGISSNLQRLAVFDFTDGYIFDGISFIYKKHSHYNMFGFAKPFDLKVWVALAIALIVSAMFYYAAYRLNPSGMDNDPDTRFDLKQSFWYSYSTIIQAGAPYEPVQLHMRVFSAFYFFFALIVIGCYTGNLANFLTEQNYPRMNTLKQLRTTQRKEGNEIFLIKGGATELYFHDQKRYFLKSGESIDWKTVNTATEGIESVENYTNPDTKVFLGNWVRLAYAAGRAERCDLVVSPSLVDIQPLAFAMRRGFELKSDIQAAMQALLSEGKVDQAMNYWLSQRGKCQLFNKEDKDDIEPLTINHFAGIIIVLAVMVVFSYIVVGAKLLFYKCGGKRTPIRKPPDDMEGTDTKKLNSGDEGNQTETSGV
ncbi:glutamate receptor ionotropic, kainate 1-like [Tubulanus polymorphus]|uniref:glutamate receptor ionotropic, kainate 1-like n=1 Tax=Tubulanus polymorphus TaxID=672921 RepID=UPI003DA58D83